MKTISIAAVLLAALASAGISTSSQTPASNTDTSWVRTFAVPYHPLTPHPPFIEGQGHENALNGDPRFAALLHSSFSQKQWFWYDHYHFPPVADLITTFIGVSGSALLDDNRYVTADGCVPHDCGDRGMLWIDTGTKPATLIFVATGDIRDVKGSNATHLWLFASKHLDFENLPPDFLSSLQRWHDLNTANNYKEDFVLATLVQPNGEMVDLTYPTLNFKQNEPGAKP
jgi:hypothetical protein